MADRDVIRKFEINETKINQTRSTILYKVTYSCYNLHNLLEANENVTVWKKFKDFEKLHADLLRLRSALYIKEPAPAFPDTKTSLFKKEFSQEQIEERRKSALDLLEYIARFPCFYKNKLFTKFFEESEIKVDRQVLSGEEMLRSLSRSSDHSPFDSGSHEPNNNSTGPNLNANNTNANSFPVPFQHLQNNQSQENLDKKFRGACDPSVQHSIDSSGDKESNDTYLVDACHLICQGQSSEERQEYESAFESYKCAVSIMLKGVKHEKDRAKKLNVRKKVEKYLAKAETIYDTHLTKEERASRKCSLDTPYKQIMRDELGSNEKNALSKYKLLSISNKVQIVFDLQLGEKFAIKVVHKISNLSSSNRRLFIFPRQVPSMVRLYQVYESEHSYFLILEFLNCSRLSDILDQISQQLSPCVECLFDDDPAEQLSVGEPDEELDDIDDLEEILFDKEKFNEAEDGDGFYQLARSDSVKTLSGIEEDLLNYPRCKMVASRSEQKLSGLAHSRSSTDFKSVCSNKPPNNISSSSTANKSTPFNTLTGIFDRARNLIKNVDQTIRNTAIDQAKLSLDNVNLQCNLNNYILERINDKLLHTYYCDRHLGKQLSDCEMEGKMLFTEEMVKRCLYEIIVALENLHDQGVIYINLNPSKILVSEDLTSVSLAYKYSLDYKAIAASENLDPANISQLIRSSFYSTYSSSTYSYYIAPELFVCGFEISPAVDWYSFGCLTYELLTNKPLCSLIPSINCRNLIQFPSYLPIEAKDLIEKLLQINPSERLNSADAVKSHVFFKPL